MPLLQSPQHSWLPCLFKGLGPWALGPLLQAWRCQHGQRTLPQCSPPWGPSRLLAFNNSNLCALFLQPYRSPPLHPPLQCCLHGNLFLFPFCLFITCIQFFVWYFLCSDIWGGFCLQATPSLVDPWVSNWLKEAATSTRYTGHFCREGIREAFVSKRVSMSVHSVQLHHAVGAARAKETSLLNGWQLPVTKGGSVLGDRDSEIVGPLVFFFFLSYSKSYLYFPFVVVSFPRRNRRVST